MLTAQDIHREIQSKLGCEYIHVQGDDGVHFEAVVVSVAFEHKTRVMQHQMVYQALGDKMHQEIHALALKTYTPTQWLSHKQSI